MIDRFACAARLAIRASTAVQFSTPYPYLGLRAVLYRSPHVSPLRLLRDASGVDRVVTQHTGFRDFYGEGSGYFKTNLRCVRYRREARA